LVPVGGFSVHRIFVLNGSPALERSVNVLLSVPQEPLKERFVGLISKLPVKRGGKLPMGNIDVFMF
jgi:hypothetical protein